MRQTNRRTDGRTYLNASQCPEFGAQRDGDGVTTATDATNVFIESFRQIAPETPRTPERTATFTHPSVHRRQRHWCNVSCTGQSRRIKGAEALTNPFTVLP